ncbi:unnamed protein product [Lupinus luteus]|uniref:Uncharacterized protein n=1 Tax=Lupinus luteus TaxID=3873 RepID=A0AAV1WGL0_LUPLU
MKGNNTVNVDAVVQREKVVVAGWEAMIDEVEVAEGVLWFNSFSNVGEKNSVGLSSAIVERMKWEQERVGWIEGKEKQIRVTKVEVFEGTKEWKKLNTELTVLGYEGISVITAHARDKETDDTDYSFIHCDITGTGTLLGRA